MPKSIMRLLAAFGFILCSALPGMAEPTGMPLIAGADTAGGYAGDVLVKVLPAWQPPAGASGIVTISNAVLTGVIREGVIPPRPAGSEPLTMRLLFTLKNN